MFERYVCEFPNFSIIDYLLQFNVLKGFLSSFNNHVLLPFLKNINYHTSYFNNKHQNYNKYNNSDDNKTQEYNDNESNESNENNDTKQIQNVEFKSKMQWDKNWIANQESMNDLTLNELNIVILKNINVMFDFLKESHEKNSSNDNDNKNKNKNEKKNEKKNKMNELKLTMINLCKEWFQ